MKVLYQLKTFELFQKSESETSNACQCFRNFSQFAAVSESERMYALLSRRLVQKSRPKMGPVDTSEMVSIEANQTISERNLNLKRLNAAWSPSFHPLHFPLHAGDHYGVLH